MAQVDYSATIEVPRPTVWEFVRDMNNWAPFATGYQEHEVINDRESVWTVKGEVGPISRVTKFKVVITEWVEQEKVAFTLEGINEPITGGGAILLTDGDGHGTDIRADAELEFGGSLGPIISPFIGPWIKTGADDLITQIAVALQPDDGAARLSKDRLVTVVIGVGPDQARPVEIEIPLVQPVTGIGRAGPLGSAGERRDQRLSRRAGHRGRSNARGQDGGRGGAKAESMEMRK